MRLAGKQIQSVTAASLTYLDESGSEHVIDFQTCYENYLARITSPERLENVKQWNNMSDEDITSYIEEAKNWKEIGARSISGDESSKMQPYIKFYTQPPTRFEFATVAEFYDVQNSIRRARWKTIDLT